ncbi:uncharacterized protein Dvar_85550 [Desulfosarcina variabilis str. Montpellier]|uniref:hypothetical protein n=1 Tax=Desulfosarcina variabilis TaxID=2300 RepID=UPI003AFB7DD1
MNNGIKWVLFVCLLTLTMIAGGCEGTDTRERVDDTVEEMTGKKDVERYKKLKDDIQTIQNQQADRYRQLDEGQDKE